MSLSTPQAGGGQFPPKSWLGFGLDMTSVTPTDIKSVTQSVLRVTRVISLEKSASSQSAGGVTWMVPDNIDLADDVNSGTSSYDHFDNGTEASDKLRTDASISAKYMAVSGDGSMDYSITKSYNSNEQYSMFSFNQTLMEVSFEDWGSYINSHALKARLANLPKFDPHHPDPDVVAEYRSLFETLGSHIITGTTYGACLRLHIRCDNSNSDVNQNFAANLSVAFNGLTASGKIDASVATTNQYKAFTNKVQKQCSCMGGDVALATTLASNTSTDSKVYETFQEWVQSSQKLPDVMSMQIMTLWGVMSASPDPDVSSRVPDVEKAYDWIVNKPQVHQTKARFVINSDWGEVGLLTPSAYIITDPDSPVDPSLSDNLNFAPTKITWGKEHSHEFKRDVTIDFVILNDGSPVDIELSHGSDGDQAGTGTCRVEFKGNTYDNSGIHGNNWNTQWYYKCEVNPTPSGTV